MKTQILTLAVILIMSLNLSANNNVNPDHITPNVIEVTSEKEEALNIEEWMTNDALWNHNNSLSIEAWMTDDNLWNHDNSLAIEEWMTNDKLWTKANFNTINTTIEKEVPLTIQNWMTNDNLWSL